jgi:hypothetical protein
VSNTPARAIPDCWRSISYSNLAFWATLRTRGSSSRGLRARERALAVDYVDLVGGGDLEQEKLGVVGVEAGGLCVYAEYGLARQHLGYDSQAGRVLD